MKRNVVLFDWGGVLSPGGTPDELTHRLEKVIDCDAETTRAFVKPLAAKLKRGQLSVETFWHELEVKTGRIIPPQNRDIWASPDSLRPDPKIELFIDRLKATGYKVGILSNVFPNTAEMIRSAGWYNRYEPVFLSSELHMAKPDPKIYEYVCTTMNISPNEVLFIDDQQRCLNPASAIGMKTILAISPEQIIRDVRKELGL